MALAHISALAQRPWPNGPSSPYPKKRRVAFPKCTPRRPPPSPPPSSPAPAPPAGRGTVVRPRCQRWSRGRKMLLARFHSPPGAKAGWSGGGEGDSLRGGGGPAAVGAAADVGAGGAIGGGGAGGTVGGGGGVGGGGRSSPSCPKEGCPKEGCPKKGCPGAAALPPLIPAWPPPASHARSAERLPPSAWAPRTGAHGKGVSN